jgi:energy-coupling factor transport system permease protein
VTPPAPRLLHPGAWWLWALSLAFAAMHTTNPVLLVTIAAVAGLVVAARRVRAPWARAFGMLLRVGLVAILITVLLQLAVGIRTPGYVLFRLPSVPLPHWTAGLSLGGPITAESQLNAFDAGLRLAVVITCFGAANSLAHPARLVRILPAALYEVGVAVVVALTFVPQLAESIVRVRTAQRLRGRPLRGLRGIHGLIVPVLEESLERAIHLAASMDSRGYGRRADRPAWTRRITAGLVLVGLGGAIAGTYQIIDSSSDHRLGTAMLIAGTAVAVAGGLLAGRRVSRTRYQPDPWGWPEWLVVGCGTVVVVTYQAFVHDSLYAGLPLAWPTLPIVPFLATLLAALPAYCTPAVPLAYRPQAAATLS